MGQRLGNFSEAITAPLAALGGSEEGQARVGATAAGLFAGAVLEPLEGLAGLTDQMIDLVMPGDVETPFERMENYLARAREGIFSQVEENAKRAGMTDEEIALSYGLGNFAGFIAPIGASIGIAKWTLKGNAIFQGLDAGMVGRHIKTGDLITDTLAGGIFGAAFRPAEGIEERLRHTTSEAAIAGMARVILTGSVGSFAAYSNKRKIQMGKQRDLEVQIAAADPLELEIITSARAGTIESRIANEMEGLYRGAQDINLKPSLLTANEQTLMEATAQLADGKSGAVILHAADNLVDVNDFLKNIKRDPRFENYTFLTRSPRKRSLTLDQKRLDKLGQTRDELVERMRVRADEGRRPQSRDLKKLNRLNKEIRDIHDVRLEDVYDIYVSPIPIKELSENLKATAKKNARKFKDINIDQFFSAKNIRKVFDTYGVVPGMTLMGRNNGSRYKFMGFSKEFRTDLAEGRLPRLTGDKKVVVQTGDGKITSIAWKHLERGVGVDDFAQKVRGITMEDWYQSYSKYADDAYSKLASTKGAVTQGELIRLIRSAPQLIANDDLRRMMDFPGAVTFPEQIGYINGINPESIATIEALQEQIEIVLRNTETDPTIAVQVNDLQKRLADLQARMTKGSAGDVMETIARTGDSSSAVVADDPWVWNEDDIFDMFASENGFVTDSPEFKGLRSMVMERRREEMWSLMDDDVYNLYREEVNKAWKAVEDSDLALRDVAHTKGFVYYDDIVGQEDRVFLKDIQSGHYWSFRSEEVARRFLFTSNRQFNNVSMAGYGPLIDNEIPKIQGDLMDPDTGIQENLPVEVIGRDTGGVPWQTMRGLSLEIERNTGFTMFTEGFEPITKTLALAQEQHGYWANQLNDLWGGIKTKHRIEVGKVWSKMEGTQGLEGVEFTRQFNQKAIETIGRELTEQELNAISKSRIIFNEWFKATGLDPRRYMDTYFSGVLPNLRYGGTSREGIALDEWVRQNEVPTLKEDLEWWQQQKKGEMSTQEFDPLFVMNKYIRSLLFSKHVRPHWDRMYSSVKLKWGDLTPDQQARLLPGLSVSRRRTYISQYGDNFASQPSFLANEHVLADDLRHVMTEYLAIVRGAPAEGTKAVRQFTRNLFNRMGVPADERILENFIGSYMGTMYGAAMAFRPSLIVRNMTQNMWLLYPRLGGKHMQDAMGDAITVEGFQEALDAGAIRLSEGGTVLGEVYLDQMIENGVKYSDLDTSGKILIGAMVNGGLIGSKYSRKMTQLGMTAYQSADEANRVWAYHWQKRHTQEWLGKWDAGEISEAEFVKKGLSFYDPVIQQEFLRKHRYESVNSALQYIGKQAADEANFIYGMATQPLWMQKVWGRFLGMFGTWPLWLTSNYANAARFASQDKLAFANYVGRTALMAGIVSNMAFETGRDIWNWIAPSSIPSATFGPVADVAVDLYGVVEAPWNQKIAAIQSTGRKLGRLSFPGQIFLTSEMADVWNADNMYDAGLRILAGRPGKSLTYDNFFVDTVLAVPNFQQQALTDDSLRVAREDIRSKLRGDFEASLARF
jgi:hypothetical protein